MAVPKTSAENKKYEFTGKSKRLDDGTVVYQIRAKKDFGGEHSALIKKGDIGGWIEKESNLSHKGECWVDDNAIARGNVRVYNDARLADNADVSGGLRISGDHTYIYGNARIHATRGSISANGSDIIRMNGDIKVNCKELTILGRTYISDSAKLSGKIVLSNTKISDNATISGRISIDNSEINNSAKVLDDTRIEKSNISGHAIIQGTERVYEKTVAGNTVLGAKPEKASPAPAAKTHPHSSGRSAATPSHTGYQEIVTQAQSLLYLAGFSDIAHIDGLQGKETKAALNAYINEQNLPSNTTLAQVVEHIESRLGIVRENGAVTVKTDTKSYDPALKEKFDNTANAVIDECRVEGFEGNDIRIRATQGYMRSLDLKGTLQGASTATLVNVDGHAGPQTIEAWDSYKATMKPRLTL